MSSQLPDPSHSSCRSHTPSLGSPPHRVPGAKKTFSTRSVDDVASSSFNPSKSLISKTSNSELDELTRLNVPRDAAYFSQEFPGREALIKKSGFKQYDDVISDLTTTYQNNPILNEAGFPVYFHGSRSGSLPNILKNWKR